MLNALILAAALSLNGSWDFRFEENKTLESASSADFAATDSMVVPGCFDVMPKWYLKHGTGLYRRTFALAEPMKDAVLVVDGMGIRSMFAIDGRDLGVQACPYARLEIPVGPLAAGEHTVFAAVDNIMETGWLIDGRDHDSRTRYCGFSRSRRRGIGVRPVNQPPSSWNGRG